MSYFDHLFYFFSHMSDRRDVKRGHRIDSELLALLAVLSSRYKPNSITLAGSKLVRS